MRFQTAILCLVALAPWPAAAQTSPAALPAGCVEVDAKVRASFNSGNLARAEAALSEFLAGGLGRSDTVCKGLAWHYLAVVASSAGRPAEAEGLEDRALRILYVGREARDDPGLLQPLYILWSVRFQQGKYGRAREALHAWRSLSLAQPEDRALLSGAAAEQLFAEGRYGESEREFRNALREWDNSGHGVTPYNASLLNGPGLVCMAQGRHQDAEGALQRVFEMFSSSSETLPRDLMTLFASRGFLRAREERCGEAEEDLSAAIATAEREAVSDPALVKPLLVSHAYVLRKMHRNKQARSVENRAKSIGTPALAGNIVDITQLAAALRRGKK